MNQIPHNIGKAAWYTEHIFRILTSYHYPMGTRGSHLNLMQRSKNEWRYTSTLPIHLMAWCSVKKTKEHRDNSTFLKLPLA